MPKLKVPGLGHLKKFSLSEEDISSLNCPNINNPADSTLYSFVLRVALTKEYLDSGAAKNGDRRRSFTKTSIDSRKPRRRSDFIRQDSLNDFVRRMFAIEIPIHEPFVSKIIPFCNEETVFRDLTNALNQLENDMSPGCTPDDFQTPEQYSAWKQAEKSELIKMMTEISNFYPQLVKTLSKRMARTGMVPAIKGFSLVPDQRKEYYKRLLRKCLELDSESNTLQSSGLSQGSTVLLAECGNRWRLSSTFRATAYLESLVERFRSDISLFPVTLEVMAKINYVVSQNYEVINREDDHFHCSMLLFLKDLVVQKAFQPDPGISGEEFAALLTKSTKALEMVAQDEVFLRSCGPYSPSSDSLLSFVHEACKRRYDVICHAAISQNHGVAVLDSLDALSDTVLRESGFYERVLEDREVENRSIRSVAIATLLELYMKDVESWWTFPQPLPRTELITELFQTYSKVWSLYSMSQNYIQADTPIPPSSLKWDTWFRNAVDAWVVLSHQKTCEWIENAMNIDKFQVEGEGYCSTSVFDLLTVLHKEIDVLSNLAWPTFHHRYRLVRMFAKLLCSAFDLFAQITIRRVEVEMDDIVTSPDAASMNQSTSDNSTDAKIKHRFKTAKHLFQSSKVKRRQKQQRLFGISERYDRACVMINNVAKAADSIDAVYAQLMAPVRGEIASYMPFSHEEETILKVQLLPADLSAECDDRGKIRTHRALHAELIVEGNTIGRIPVRSNADSGINPDTNLLPDDHLEMPFSLSLSLEFLLYQHDATRDSEQLISRGRATVTKNMFQKQLYNKPVVVKNVVLEGGQGMLPVRFTQAEHDYIFYWFTETFVGFLLKKRDLVAKVVEKVLPHVRDTVDMLIKKFKRNLSVKGFPLPLKRGGLGGFQHSNSKSKSHLANAESEHAVSIPNLGESDQAEVEFLLVPLLEMLNRHLYVWNNSLEPALTLSVLKRLWHGIVEHFEYVCTERVSQKTGKRKLLNSHQVHICRSILTTLLDFLHADGEGLPMQELRSNHFRWIDSLLDFYTVPSDDLMRTYLSSMVHHATDRAEKVRRLASGATLRRGSSNFAFSRNPTMASFRPKKRAINGGSAMSPTDPVLSPPAEDGSSPCTVRKEMPSLNQDPETVPPAAIASSVHRRGSTDSGAALPMDAPAFAFASKSADKSRAHAIYTLLDLRSENDIEVKQFLQQQQVVEMQILENLNAEQPISAA